MRNWGFVITAFYALTVMGLLVPGSYLIAGSWSWHNVQEFYSEWLVWIAILILVGGQVLLLFLSVDTSQKRLTPRTHVAVSFATAALLMALLAFAAVWSLAIGFFGDEVFEKPISLWVDSRAKVLGWWCVLWCLWFVMFFMYFREAPKPFVRVISWLLKGSVLELLVAVPCHVVVRQRGDCSAPVATGLGIATGLAIMLLSFGPSVLFLYKKRLKGYSRRSGTI